MEQKEWYSRQREIHRQSQALSRKWMPLSMARNVGSMERERRGGWCGDDTMDEAAEVAGTRFGGFVAYLPVFILF